MKLQTFNGGLSNRLAPHLIGVNEGATFSNIDIDDATLSPVKKNSLIQNAISKYAHYFITKDEWVNSSINRDYIEYQEKLYWTEDNSIPQVYDGSNTNLLGIKKPNNIPVLTASTGILTGTYTYVYTYYSVNTGIESSISLLAEITLASQQVTLSSLNVSGDSQVTHKRIYRVGGFLTEFTLVTTIANSLTTYIDNIGDTAVDGRLLESETYLQAKYGAKYLIEAYAMMFYALGDKLYFTPIGKPWAWPEEFFIDFPLDITGIGVVNNGLLIFTKLQTYIVTGNTPETLSRYPLSSTQGCVSHKTIKKLVDTLIWWSYDGLCASTGGTPQVISRDKLGSPSIDPIVAVIHDDVYYLQHTLGSLVYDVRFGPVYRDLNLGNTYLVEGNDKIYGYFTDGYYELFTDIDSETFNYLSPVFLDGEYTNRKNYKTFYVRSKGYILITIYVDGKNVQQWELTTEDTHDLDIPQEYKNGYSVQFSISGTGTVYEINYKPFGSARNG